MKETKCCKKCFENPRVGDSDRCEHGDCPCGNIPMNTPETMEEELEKAQRLLGEEKNYTQVTFYEGYIKGLRFGQETINQEISLAISSHNKELVEKGMSLKKYHKEFECNGANNGRGCYEDFCEDQECRNAPKEYNQALADFANLIKDSKK